MTRWLPFLKSSPRVAVVRMTGAIGAGGPLSLSDQSIGPVLEAAFQKGKPDAVAIEINSPGGSPVQSSLIGARIRRLADKRGIKVYAFVEDVAASGGYWLASAADEIWADPASIVGSVGVISASFGANDLLARQGIERRVHTAGTHKSFMDPFLPLKDQDVARLRGILDQMHQTFIDQVKAGRGTRLNGSDASLFNGDFWLAGRAHELGLIDGIGHLKPKMQEVFGDKVSFRRYGLKKPFLRRIGADIAQDALAAIEERASYARYGL